MNISMYVINAALILLVIRQIREHPLDLRSLAVPVLAARAGVRAGRRGHGRHWRPGYLSNATVKTHINRIFAKTGARGRAQAVRYAYQHGLTTPAQ